MKTIFEALRKIGVALKITKAVVDTAEKTVKTVEKQVKSGKAK